MTRVSLAVCLLSLVACGADSPSGGDAAETWVVDTAEVAPPLDTVAPVPDIIVSAPTAPLDAPFPIAVTAGAPLTATVTVTVAGVAHPVHLYRGRGSVTLQGVAAGALAVSVEGAPRPALLAEARPRREVAGVLSGGDLAWSPDADVVVAADASVPAGATLTIAGGTRVLLADRVNLEIAGALRAGGGDAAPVLFTASGAAWGGLRVAPGATAELDGTWFVAGGGDPGRAFGHSASQPVVWVDGASLIMRGGGVLDSPGKAFGARDATLSLTDVRVARCDTGGELEATWLTAERLHVSEIPDADGVIDDDDNDGIYLRGVATVGGEAVESVLRDCVFAVGEDDGVDHNDALVRIERAWIEGFLHEGVAASVGHRVTLVDSVVRGCEQGIEAGYGAPEVVVERTTVTDCGAGLRFGDSYDWDDLGSLTVTGSIIYGNDVDVRNFARGLGGPKPDAITVACSVVGDPAWVGLAGNVAGPPEGAWERGCATGPGLPAAQCTAPLPGPDCAGAER
ncbi:MAG: hypothetical protein CVU56_03350 [Deltaproteobacteria bacterium HGW-Deltaproteobacteria-14]|nr:MAG: hypothetical protein CVU56_03350 [Deltaproteobacteria bacterium HGW-Deltaproteobacteria-14]